MKKHVERLSGRNKMGEPPLASNDTSERYVELPSDLIEDLTQQLSPDLTYGVEFGCLPDATKATIARLEDITGAYFFYEPYKWMGVAHDRGYPDLPPKTPVPMRKALERIGFQYLHWHALADEVQAGRIGLAPVYQRHILQVDQRSAVHIIQNPEKAREEAQRLLKKPDTYNSYSKQPPPEEVALMPA